MIFVTIGTQAPFDRLIKSVDKIVPELRGMRVIAQTFESEYKPQNMETVGFLTPQKFEEIFSEASIIVAHAGMGTIISAITLGKTVIVMPRSAKLGEHRNDHQLATVRRLSDFSNVHIALDDIQLKEKIISHLKGNVVKPEQIVQTGASPELLSSIRTFVNSK